MQSNFYKYCLYILLTIPGFIQIVNAQEAIVTTGVDAQANSGSISYTIGQTSFSQYQGINEKVTEGVQQPFEILIISGAKTYSQITLECTAFPNPTTNFLYLNIKNNIPPGLEYRLFSQSGALLRNEPIYTNETTIKMSQYISATYILNILNQNNTVKSFQIIKH